MRQVEVVEVGQCVLIIINITAIFGDSITRRRKWRNAIDAARNVAEPRPQSNQAHYLSSINPDLQEVGGLEFLEQKVPHHMEGVFTEAAAVARNVVKIKPMLPQLSRQLLVEIAHALQIEAGRAAQALVPGRAPQRTL